MSTKFRRLCIGLFHTSMEINGHKKILIPLIFENIVKHVKHHFPSFPSQLLETLHKDSHIQRAHLRCQGLWPHPPGRLQARRPHMKSKASRWNLGGNVERCRKMSKIKGLRLAEVKNKARNRRKLLLEWSETRVKWCDIRYSYYKCSWFVADDSWLGVPKSL